MQTTQTHKYANKPIEVVSVLPKKEWKNEAKNTERPRDEAKKGMKKYTFSIS